MHGGGAGRGERGGGWDGRLGWEAGGMRRGGEKVGVEERCISMRNQETKPPES